MTEPTPDLQRVLEELERPFGVTPETELVRSTIAALSAENAELRTALAGMHGSFQKAKAERDTARAECERLQRALDELRAATQDVLDTHAEQPNIGLHREHGWWQAKFQQKLAAARAALEGTQ